MDAVGVSVWGGGGMCIFDPLCTCSSCYCRYSDICSVVENNHWVSQIRQWYLYFYVPPYQRVGVGGGGGGRVWDGSSWCQCLRQRKTSCRFCNLTTLWNILMILGRNVEQDQTACRAQEWQLSLSYFWSYHPLFYLKKILCPLCNLNTLWNILMVLGRNVAQDQTTCCVQEWQLYLSYFWCYFPLLCLTVIIHWFPVRSVSQRPFGIFLWYLVEM